MSLDLSALEEPLGARSHSGTGRPLELTLSDIEEDPGQPRHEFDPAPMAEMTESIRLRGVRQPISVRSHPHAPGRWLLNYGSRRLRAARAAGLEAIPAFVDETSDAFDQVIENEQRENLRPMELALFIQRMLDEGIPKAEIARRLAKPAAMVTEHLALIDAPPCIEAVYRSGRCTSAKTLYELRSLHRLSPDAVAAWCEQTDEVTRGSVAELRRQLKEQERSVPVREATGTSKASADAPALPESAKARTDVRAEDPLQKIAEELPTLLKHCALLIQKLQLVPHVDTRCMTEALLMANEALREAEASMRRMLELQEEQSLSHD